MASDVLADGRFVISGGEYNEGGDYQLQLVNLGAVYDPYEERVDADRSPEPVEVDRRFSLERACPTGDCSSATSFMCGTPPWIRSRCIGSTVGHTGKSDFNAEEGWTLLANGTILTADVKNAPNSEIYNPATGNWKSAGSTIVDLHSPSPYHSCLPYGPEPKDCYLPPGEIGPSILRPDGSVFYTGSYSCGYGAGHTAIYYSTGSKAGTWATGPNFPNGDNAGDSFAALEPSGNVLVFGDSGTLYEWNGTTFTQVNGASEAGPPILLPTGQIMMVGILERRSVHAARFAPSELGSEDQEVPSEHRAGQTYKITGTQFNGLGQAMSFGDEFQNATNYPLVRITNNSSGNVYYARTHNHSTMGVATGFETRLDVLRRSRHDRFGREHARSRRQRHRIKGGQRDRFGQPQALIRRKPASKTSSRRVPRACRFTDPIARGG